MALYVNCKQSAGCFLTKHIFKGCSWGGGAMPTIHLQAACDSTRAPAAFGTQDSKQAILAAGRFLRQTQ